MPIVDTNVPVVANSHSEQASPDCVTACVNALQDITDSSERLVLDDDWAVIREYLANLRSDGQPGVGDAFLRWVLTNQANPARCELIALPVDAEGEYEHFPKDHMLARFDPADRKFVALALAHPSRPRVLEAVDPDWWHHRRALHANGVVVQFLCPQDIARLAE